jgi:phytanoyl-CoA hydroxylase
MAGEQAPAVMFDREQSGNYPADLYRFDRVAEMVEDFDSITDEHLDFFQEQGYLAIRHAFSPIEVESALEGLLDLIGGENPEFDGIQFEAWARNRLDDLRPEEKQDYVRKLMHFVSYEERLRSMAGHPELLALLRRIIGEEELRMFQDMALLKPPGEGREKPWHQDKAFFTLRLESPVVGVWIALDEATAENGCMHVIPGSHREGPVVHFKRRDWQICDDQVQTSRDVMVPLPPGGCLLFDGLIQHGTPDNRSTKRRRAVQFHYTAANAEWGSQEDRMVIFGSEGKDVTC